MKYRNAPTRCQQGTLHHSRIEAARCDELHVLQAGGLISNLEAHPQPKFDLSVNGTHICHYIADFAYYDAAHGEQVVEDVKGFVTDVYKFKKRLMMACHNIEVQEVRRVRGRR